jgi:ribosome biogenesis GTPase
VADQHGERSAVLAGRLRHAAASREDLPAVGDWVAIAAADADGTTTIHLVVPRRSAFLRRAVYTVEGQVVAANVDVALIATALPDDLNLHRLDRYLTLGWESGATPVVVLTKADLSHDVPAAIARVRTSASVPDVLAVSAATGEGIDRLAEYLIRGRTAVLLGSSGVGKSTLVNRLLGETHLRTADVRDDGRGRHTTTHRELVTLANGALLIDTPGMRELQLWNADTGLDTAFSDIDELAGRCRFRDCGHNGEPGCAVIEAILRGVLAADRLEHWRKLERELAYMAVKQDERAASAARARVRSLTRNVRAHIRDKYGE